MKSTLRGRIPACQVVSLVLGLAILCTARVPVALAAETPAKAPAGTPAIDAPLSTPAQGKTPRLTAKQRQTLKALVGRWKMEDAEDELEFRPDGSFLGKSHEVEMRAKYEISPEGDLIVDLGLPVPRKPQGTPAGQAPAAATPTPPTLRVVREVRFEGKKLVLRDRETGQTFRYVRLR